MTQDELLGVRGQTALVTGAAGGLGRAIVELLGLAGARVIACDRDQEALADLERQSDVPLQLARVVDVTDVTAVAAMFEAMDQQGVRTDVVVNVVGGTGRRPFLETGPSDWLALYQWNLQHVMQITQESARRMVDDGREGSIINITSIEGHRAAPGYAVYAAMKTAVIGLTRSLALEFGHHGIRVNCVAPDYVRTQGVDMLEASLGRTPISPDEGSAMVPLGRLATPIDVARAVLFLASDLSAFVTGSTIHPDGGALVAGRWARFRDVWEPRLVAPAEDPKGMS